MPLFDPWSASPEFAAAKKIVDDVAGRIATVKADTARITPKLGTFKKETLAKLIKENKAKYDAAAAANAAAGNSQPEGVYMKKVETLENSVIARIQKDAAAQIASVKLSAKKEIDEANAFRANGGGKGGGSQGITARLCEEYSKLVKALEKELAEAAKEKAPDPARKV